MHYAPSPWLYYGPSAEETARAAAAVYGRVLKGEAVGALRKGDARELVELLSRTVVSGREAVVVGPVDEILPATADVFLKTMEERGPYTPQPFLWAWDWGGVTSTLRSRCLGQWAGGVDPRWEPYGPTATQLLGAWRRSDWVAVIEELKEARGDLDYLLRAVVEGLPAVLSEDKPGPDPLALWLELRPLMSGSPLTPARVVSAFLSAASASEEASRG